MDFLHGLQSATDSVFSHVGGAFSFLALKAEESVQVALHGRDGALLAPQRPLLDGHVHCDVVQARGLLPVATRGADTAHWSSDPFVEAQLLRSSDDALDDAHTPNSRHARDRRATAKTGVRVETLHPIFDEELLLFAACVDGADTVRFHVHDEDGGALLDGAAALGYCDVPLPPRPPALEHRREGAATPLVEGWFPLKAPPSQMAKLAPLLAKLGRTHDPCPLGELFVRVSWGVGVRNAAVNHRPPLRRRLGRLFLAVHAADGLPPAACDRPAVIARFEHQVGVTPHCEGTSAPTWAPDAASFLFAVTEITSDLVLCVVSRDNVLGVQHIGEVVVPMAALLAVPGGGPTTHWASILPPRGPGESLLRPQPTPRHPLGRLRFSVGLDMEVSLPFAYLCPDVPMRECAHGTDVSDAFSVDALHVSLGRVLDCALAPLFAPARTVLYLQTWQAPRLNVSLLILLFVATRPSCWRVTLLCAPLWLLLAPFLHGLINAYIHADDPAPLYAEERASLARAAAAPEDAAHARAQRVVAAQNALLERAAQRDPSLAQHRLALIPGGAAVSHLGSILGSAVRKTTEEADHLNVVKAITAKLAGAHAQLLAAAAPAERARSALDWSDARLTGVLCVLAATLGLVLSAALAVTVWLAACLGLCARTATLLGGLACFCRAGAPLTRAALAAADESLSSLRGFVRLPSLLSGSGLACTAPPPPAAPLSAAAETAAIQAEAEAFVERQQHARQAELAARGTLRTSALRLSDATSGAWLARLLARAPDVPRKRHLAMAARALNTPSHEAQRSSGAARAKGA
jgi:hypothetical protein